jgi:hypothetical protein
MKHVSKIFLGATLLSIVACGNNSDKSSQPSSKSLLLAESGHYEATLAPLNAHLAGDVEGKALVKVKGDSITFEVKVNGAPSSIKHAQYIHVAESCPTLSSDENNDGVIDAVEGMKSFGPIVIPLDSHLETQKEANATFPVADFSGNYFYRQSVSMAKMMFDLTAKDLDTSDHIIKISSSLGLAGRQIVVYGVAEDAVVPESVQSFHGKTKHASVPIACGSFVKIAVDEEGSSSTGGKE